MSLQFTIAPGETGRVDRAIADRLGNVSRRRLNDLFSRGTVRIDGRIARKGTLVSPGSVVILSELPASNEELYPTPIAGSLQVLHDDAELLAVSKPAGMPSHPLRRGETGTLANHLVAQAPMLTGIGRDPREAGLVHRLDAGTSGVIIAAKTQQAWEELRAQFAGKRIAKTYLALVEGRATSGGCTLPLIHRGKRSVQAPDDPRALDARTAWEVVEATATRTLIRCRTKTGRMHQVRSHLAVTGHPIVGDVLYGATNTEPGFYLHAESIELSHPQSKSAMRIEAPVPAVWPRRVQNVPNL